MAGVTRKDVAAVTEPASEPEAVEGKATLKPASFGLCEGTREEVERLGKAVDPFTGNVVTRDDLK